MDGLNDLINVVEDKIDELGGSEYIGSTTAIKATDVLNKILTDPNLEIGDPDDNGVQKVLCKGREIGWVNSKTGECDVDESYCSKDINASRKITAASSIETESDLRDAIEDVLDYESALEVVNLAIAEDGTFEDHMFIESKQFFETEMANKSPKEIAEAFFYGKNMDNDKEANPTQSYMRLNDDGEVETTDYPGDVYLFQDDLTEEIIGYIMDHIEELEFPSYIQNLIDEYLDNKAKE